MSSQHLATLDQGTPPDVTPTLAERRSLTLPAFPVAPAPTESISQPDPATAAPDSEHDRPRAEKEATGSLRRFPLGTGRPRVGRHLPVGETPLDEAVSDAATTPPQVAPVRARRSLLPAAPTEPQMTVQEVFAPAAPPLTGEGSIIDRKAPTFTPGTAAAPAAMRQTPQRGRFSALLPDSPALLAGALLLIGALVLVWAIVTRPPQPYGALLVLNALGLGLAGGLLSGLSAWRARRERRRPVGSRRS